MLGFNLLFCTNFSIKVLGHSRSCQIIVKNCCTLKCSLHLGVIIKLKSVVERENFEHYFNKRADREHEEFTYR